MKKCFLYSILTFILFSSFNVLTAQRLNHVLGDVLIQPVSGIDIQNIKKELQQFEGTNTKLEIINLVSKPLNIWKIHFDQNSINEFHFLRFLNGHPKIAVAQFNHLVKMRETIPNDAFFAEQWQYINDGSNGGTIDGDIDADLAWDITTGGVTALGDTIVAAVLDDGIDLNHEDFGDNLWVNHAEIPNNGIDDDNNGYVDDYRGWSIISNDDNITGGGHGTPVAGIVGAQGNNDIGVSGVNWDVKIMVIKNNFNTNEAAVLEAYSYALEARIKYNQTNGAEGAFVVSTNASWGVDFGDPADAPLWCGFYDTLGEAGIISCGATINGNQNVDEVGDLPTACPSDYLIAVTNMDRTDNKVSGAGFGAMTIDLGAHGADAYTTANGNSYNGFGGTSGATPHVTGAIALLYSNPCANLISLAKSNPGQAASFVRQYIFDGVDPNNSLEGITTTGGRLNIFNSLQLVMNDCSPCPPAYSLGTENLIDVSTDLVWSDGVFADSSNLRWRAVGAASWNEVLNASSPLSIDNLTACTDYEFQIDGICESENSGYSESFIFTSDGCCEPPAVIEATMIGVNTASISWTDVFAAESYNLQLTTPTGTFIIQDILTNSFDLSDLEACTNYSLSIQTVCSVEVTEFSELFSFTTIGCGACTDLTYCESQGDNGSFEWIESVSVADLENTSGGNDGYGDFTGLFASVMTYNTYEVSLTPGFDGSAFPEYFKIWIDFDHNGVLDPIEELAFDASAGSTETVEGMITIPETATIGLTRMRIGMEWVGTGGDGSPEPCESFGFGEVEDYCILISEGTPPNCDVAINLDTINVTENEATLLWDDFTDDHSNHNVRIKQIMDTEWILFPEVDPPFTVTDLIKCSTYEYQVESNCTGSGTSGWSDSFEFNTSCLSGTNDLLTDNSVNIFPNPFTSNFQIELELTESGKGELFFMDMQGKMIFQKTFDAQTQRQSLEINNLDQIPQGIYILKIMTPEGLIFKKLMKY